MFVKILFTVAVAAQAVFGTPIQSRSVYAVKERHNLPRGWKNAGRASKSQMMYLRIGVKQSKFDELERHLYEVSDPEHVRYGKHLSYEEVNDLVKPTDEALNLLQEWLALNGITNLSYSPAKDWINIYVDVDTAERLLDTSYSIYEHADGTRLARTESWSLPTHLHAHIDTIQPTTSFMRPQAKKLIYKTFEKPTMPIGYKPPTNPELAEVCTWNGTTPACFAALYGTKGYKQQVPGKNQIGFNNFLKEVPIRPDAAKFLSIYQPKAVKGAYNFKFVDIDNGPSQDGPLTPEQLGNNTSKEANLDVQTIVGMTYPMPVTAWSTGGEPPQIGDIAAGEDPGNEPYLAWANYVLAQKFVPQVISTSYGDDEQTVPIEYAKRVCNSFAQLGARGVSLLFASGDGGAGDIAGNDAEACVSNDGKNTFKFLASFPPSCPFITAVGATQNFAPEVAAYRPAQSIGPDNKRHGYYASGSGFSEYFSRPSYQDGVVPAYVKAMKGEHTGLFNPAGRAYPDLAAQGLYFEYVWNGTVGVISGTSASTPLMASVLALVNDALIADGRSPLGFLNPWLYKKGWKGFTDILSGGNGGCNTTGFPVIPGWDAVTGFGTPRFKEIVQLAKGGY